MSNVCSITGKRPLAGNNVSHSMRHTKRRFMPNLLWKRVWNPLKKRFERIKVSTQGLKVLDKRSK
ncbi:MAG: 50S ribosomal protein L28 [Candidatus Peregrinibacteria bacterium]|nr:50S ribosomal protein L28 [Candidatus Peregrinibacteria bacterium]